MALNTTQPTQLTTTATTGESTTTTATPVWDTETFGLGTSTAAEGEKEDEYDTNEYFQTYDGKWYSRKELVEAVWEKFKDVYNWKHMRGSTARAISRDVDDIIEGLKSGDLTISGGLLYTVKGSKNYDSYSSWKSKYEGNKPHHANSKYDLNAKNNAAWVVMNAFRTLTDEDTKKKSLQESASTSSLAALRREILDDMIYGLGMNNATDYNSFYSKDALDNSTLSRSTTNRISTIQHILNNILGYYANIDLKKQYGIDEKTRKKLADALINAYKSALGGSLAQGDYSFLSALNNALGIDIDWGKLLQTDFASDEWEAAQEQLRIREEEEKKQQEYNNFLNGLYPNGDSGTDPKTQLVHTDEDIKQVYPTLLSEIEKLTAENIKLILKAAITNSTNDVYEAVLNMAEDNKGLVLLVILQAARNNNILKSTKNPDNPNEYYVPFLGSLNHVYVVDFSNGKITRKWANITDIPALEKAIKDTYDKGVTGTAWWDAFKKAAELTL